METDKVRQAFEKWVVREPYRFDVSRDEHDDSIYAVAEVKWLWDCWRAAYAQSAAPPPERPQLGTCHEVSFLHEKDKHAWAHDFDPETDKQVCVGWRAAAERPAATLEEEMVRIYIADRFALRCPACRGKNSKDAGGNKRCFHCGLCGFVECEWCSPAHEYLAESEPPQGGTELKELRKDREEGKK